MSLAKVGYLHAKLIQHGLGLPSEHQIIAGNTCGPTTEFSQREPYDLVRPVRDQMRTLLPSLMT